MFDNLLCQLYLQHICVLLFVVNFASSYFTATNEYRFDELQIYGNAHLAVLTNPVNSKAIIDFKNMIGDRTGAVHVGINQELDLKRDKIDLPFNVHVYPEGLLGLAPDTYVQDINIFLNGTLAHIENLTLYQNGNLWLYQNGKTKDVDAGSYEFLNVHVKTGGYIHMITDPVSERGIYFSTSTAHIDGGGLIRGTHMTFECENITIDSGGSMNADGLGYRITDINTDDLGLYGPINPGKGLAPKSGAGHGGSGGRGEGICFFFCHVQTWVRGHLKIESSVHRSVWMFFLFLCPSKTLYCMN